MLLGFLLFLMYPEGCFLCPLLHWALCSVSVELIAVAEIFPWVSHDLFICSLRERFKFWVNFLI